MFNRPYFDPYIIAEIGIHHHGSSAEAIRLADAAKAGGAHAIKLQHYTAALLTHREATAFWNTATRNGESSLNQLALYTSHQMLDAEGMGTLQQYCKSINLDLIATGFSNPDVDFIDPYICAHKIASCDITNIPLLQRVASKGKPIVLSCGASTLDEVKTAATLLKQFGAIEVAILHCVLKYPLPIEEASLSTIMDLAKLRGVSYTAIGYSDHTIPTAGRLEALQLATILGARVLEKHFTITPLAKGEDHYHSSTEYTLKKFTRWLANKRPIFTEQDPTETEVRARQQARRGIYAAKPIAAGELFTTSNLITLRPAKGAIPASAWNMLLGSTAKRTYNEGDPLLSVELSTQGL